MKQNIIFDIGNVILKFDPVGYLRTKFSEEAVLRQVNEAVFRSPEWIMLDEGSITETQAIDNICLRYPEIDGCIRNAMDNWYELLAPIDDTVQNIREIKAEGFGLYYLSNFHKAASEYIVRRYDFFGLFDGGIFSFEERLIKPDPRIYSRLLGKYGLKAEECIFIDDMKENVEAAQNAGMKAVLFIPGRGIKSLMEDNIQK